MVEELGGQYTAARRSYGGFSIELLILYCLGKQLTSKQAKGFQIGQSSKQRGVLLACLLISKSGPINLTSEDEQESEPERKRGRQEIQEGYSDEPNNRG